MTGIVRSVRDWFQGQKAFDAFVRPTFLLSAPRSGSTALFEALLTCGEFWAVDAEADRFWWEEFSYSDSPSHSDEILIEQLSPIRARGVRRRIYLAAVDRYRREHPDTPFAPFRFGGTPIPYLDTTIANCLHLDVLPKIFRSVRYVLMWRDPRSTISSMIEGWDHPERFGKAGLQSHLESMEPRSIEHWCYPAPPGWQAQTGATIPEICAWIWKEHTERLIGLRDANGPVVAEVRYEDLVSDPTGTLATICGALDIEVDEERLARAAALPASSTTISAPNPDKWRRHEELLKPLHPQFRDAAELLGYNLEE